MNLVIVESPAKAKTIEKYLGKDYKVMASLGHVIDLPGNKLSVDVEHDYEPDFKTIRGKGEVIKKLKRAVPKKGDVYLAMDPDREGEAIAYHVAQALKLKKPKRITFHEITKDAVNEAIKKPGEIDWDLVESQFARRVLDRLVGYKVSELLWKKIWYGLSAGRVQSVALRLIVEKEEEREAFNPEEYWDVFVDLDKKGEILRAKLSKKDGKKFVPGNKEDVEELEKAIGKSSFKVLDVSSREMKKGPYPPLKTSTLQRSANSILGMSAKRTMALAQRLYQAGYITYMRTDSLNMSKQAVDTIRKLIEKIHGPEYLPEKPKYYKTNSKGAQEAHEAIRPTDFSTTREAIKKDLGSSEAKLYDLIYRRAVSSQMTDRRSEIMAVELAPKDVKKPEYIFRVGAEKVLFDGFRKVLGGAKEEGDVQEISDISKGDEFDLKELVKEQKYTNPPARYSEAALVKMLEKLGVGRPSTYATIISTVISRGYVIKEAKALVPTDVGRVVANFLKKNFARLVDYDYTAKVEDELDGISEGKIEYVPFMESQFKPLTGEIDVAMEKVEKEDVVILGDSKEKCPECGKKMVVRLGRYGKFLSCSTFPECKGMKDLEGGEEALDLKKYHKPTECPECKKGMKMKNGKYGKYWACVDYPDKCKGTFPMLLNEKCPECSSYLVERKSKWGQIFTGCSGYPDCRYIKKGKKKSKKKS
jgi:DNA topoisomerase-1